MKNLFICFLFATSINNLAAMDMLKQKNNEKKDIPLTTENEQILNTINKNEDKSIFIFNSKNIQLAKILQKKIDQIIGNTHLYITNQLNLKEITDIINKKRNSGKKYITLIYYEEALQYPKKPTIDSPNTMPIVLEKNNAKLFCNITKKSMLSKILDEKTEEKEKIKANKSIFFESNEDNNNNN